MAEVDQLLKENLIFTNQSFQFTSESLLFLSNKAYEQGFVKESFSHAIIDRELFYPTGIQTKGFGVAIPHANKEQVIEEFISIAILSKPLRFSSMENRVDTVLVDFIFMLGLKDGSKHLKVLQQLMSCFHDQSFLKALKEEPNPNKAFKLLEKQFIGAR